MKTSKRHQDRTAQGCRQGRWPSSEARARYVDEQARATLRRMFPRF